MQRATQNAPDISMEPATGQSQDYDQLPLLQYCFIGIGIAVLWTATACGLSSLQRKAEPFFREWVAHQEPPFMGLGTCLLLIKKSKIFLKRIKKITADSKAPARLIENRWLRFGVVVSIGAIGTVSLIPMGF